MPISATAEIGDPRVAIVQKLYRDYSWETLKDLPKRATFQAAPLRTLQSYLTDGLTQLITDDRACMTRRHELCGLDFAFIWNSQDPEGIVADVGSVSVGDLVTVKLRRATGQSDSLTYHVVRTEAGWRIDDIRGKGWRLRGVLPFVNPERTPN